MTSPADLSGRAQSESAANSDSLSMEIYEDDALDLASPERVHHPQGFLEPLPQAPCVVLAEWHEQRASLDRRLHVDDPRDDLALAISPHCSSATS